MDITQKQLKYWLNYDPNTGIFTWINLPSNAVKIGNKAGWQKKGYCQIRLKGRLYYSHRLAFLYMIGAFPTDDVDHINGNRTDTTWTNLRAVTSQDNRKNAAISINNTSGVLGVVWDKRKNMWMAKIGINYKTKFLGYFDDLEMAKYARLSAEKVHQYHANHGRVPNA